MADRPSPSLLRYATRLGPAQRAEVARVLAASAAAGEPAQPPARFPALSIGGVRVAAGIGMAAFAAAGAVFLRRFYTCADDVGAAKQMLLLVSAGLGTLAARGLRPDKLVLADGHRLSPAGRRALVAAMEGSLGTDARATRIGGLTRGQWGLALLLAALPGVLGAADYALRLRTCVGVGPDARESVVQWALAGAVAGAAYVWVVLKGRREAPA